MPFTPLLEPLEARDAPSGIPDPQFTVLALGGGSPALAQTRLAQDAVGKVVSAASVGDPLPLGDQVYIKASLFFRQDLYHGTSTVVCEVPPPGVGVPADPASGDPTTARYVLDMLGGSFPVIVVPDGVAVPQGAGNLWEVRTLQQGWFAKDPPPGTPINAIPPGPDSTSSLGAPNFQEGELVLDATFLYLYEHDVGLLPLAEGLVAQARGAVGA